MGHKKPPKTEKPAVYLTDETREIFEQACWRNIQIVHYRRNEAKNPQTRQTDCSNACDFMIDIPIYLLF